TATSGDATRLYEAFRSIAATTAVRIERVEPSTSSRGQRSVTSKSETTSELLGYSIEVTGTYAAVARFMDALEQELGVTKVTSFHMSLSGVAPPGVTNAPTDPLITAIVETSHLKLTIPSVETTPAKAAKPVPKGAGS